MAPAVNLDIRSSTTDASSKLLLGNSDKSYDLFFKSGNTTANPSISFKGGNALRFMKWDGGLIELMRIKNDGSVGIGITDPRAGLHVDDTNGVLFTRTYGEGEIPVEVGGTRMMWYPAKAAFRVGRDDKAKWTNDNIGEYSVAMGRSPQASGDHSTALGYWTDAYGCYSTSFGILYSCT